ncbi:MAG: DUF4097 family beta strand repeat-containing protein [Terriglobales bacterium]
MRLRRTNSSTSCPCFLLAPLCLILAVCSLALPAVAASEGSFQRTLKVSGNVNLDVITGSGNIQVQTGRSDEVRINARIRATDWFDGNADEKIRRLESNPPIQQNGSEIRIGHIDDPELRRGISISYELVVPSETQLRAQTGSGSEDIEGIHGSADLSSGSGHLKASKIGNTVRASTGSGDVEIDQVNGNVHVKTGSGSIHATDIAGGFEGNTGSGSIHLEQTASGSVRAGTGSGSLDLQGLRGSLEASTGSGSILAEGDPTGAWNVHTGSGTVRLRFPSNASFDLDAHTSSGTVSVNFPMTTEVASGKKDVRGKVRGGGVSVHIETGSGDIEVR